MDDAQKKRARELTNWLEQAGANCGLVVVQGNLVIRGPGAPYSETPVVSFDEADLKNAISLNLLEKQKVSGSYQWDWYVVKKSPEERIRNFVAKSPDSSWQHPVGGQVISEFGNGGHCCITSEGINLWGAEGNVVSYSHTAETRARYESLMRRGKKAT
jgi:hypothetical protein